jgi:hypothetical protein
MFGDLFKVLIPCTNGLESIIATLVAIIGFVSIYLTFMFYDCKALRIVFVILGTVGLISLLLFLLSGSLCCLGLWGTIGLVVSFHALVLPEISIQLKFLNRGKPLIKIDPGCKKRGRCDRRSDRR